MNRPTLPDFRIWFSLLCELEARALEGVTYRSKYSLSQSAVTEEQHHLRTLSQRALAHGLREGGSQSTALRRLGHPHGW